MNPDIAADDSRLDDVDLDLSPPATALGIDAQNTVAGLGTRIRELRTQRRLTLRQLADLSRLSPSMISLVERGRTSPSIGTLVVVAAALGVPVRELFSHESSDEVDLVVRAGSQPVMDLYPGMSRRLVYTDRANHVEISINTYEPRAGETIEPASHRGVEYGMVLEGELYVEVSGRSYVLDKGDSIGYASVEPHRLQNPSSTETTAIWFNIGSF